MTLRPTKSYEKFIIFLWKQTDVTVNQRARRGHGYGSAFCEFDQVFIWSSAVGITCWHSPVILASSLQNLTIFPLLWKFFVWKVQKTSICQYKTDEKFGFSILRKSGSILKLSFDHLWLKIQSQESIHHEFASLASAFFFLFDTNLPFNNSKFSMSDFVLVNISFITVLSAWYNLYSVKLILP